MKQDNHVDALQKTADYLYKIDGDCPPEIYQAIATLRQLINEEFKPTKPLSSQFIYDVLFRKIDQYYADFYRNKILEVTKKPTTLPKTNHLETVKQGINFYHKTMQKRITAQFNSGGSDEDK